MSKNSPAFHRNQIEQLGHQMPGRDSSLIQSTSGSHQGVSKMSKDGFTDEQQTLAQSGDFSSFREQEGVQTRSALSLGKAEGALSSSQVDYNQFASLPYTYSAPFYGGVVTPYGTPGIPYLHESRHLHALRRERGSGGRFLNKKQQQQQQDEDQQEEDHSANTNPFAETPNSSDITTVCRSGGLSNLQEHRIFSSPGFFNSHDTGGNIRSGNRNNHGPT